MHSSSTEGPVSRHLNRRLSRPIARALASSGVTPNGVSLASLGIAVVAFAAFALDRPAAAGALVQASSVIDGVDGDLARLQGTATRYGAVHDAVLDRYADAAVIAGMALWCRKHPEASGPAPHALGMAALAGSLLVSYSRARLEDAGYADVLSGAGRLAGRDVRLLIAALGAATGRAYATLVGLSALCYGTIAWRLWQAYGRSEA